MDEQNLEQQTPQTEAENNQYIEAIRELKLNSVSREQYDKLAQENKTLVKALVEGEQLTTVSENPYRNPEEIRQELWGHNGRTGLSQCEYLEKCLELREACIDTGEGDPFVFNGYFKKPTRDDYETAQHTAEVYRECLDYANGNDQTLITELQRRMNDTPMANAIYNNNNTKRR